jgi:hypothetical protein
MKFALAAAAVAVLPLVSPVNDRVPVFDVAVSCRAAASAGISVSQSYQSCMNDERSAREDLVRDWASFAAGDRSRCTAESSGGGLPSYVELLVCLQMARDASRMRTPPQ